MKIRLYQSSDLYELKRSTIAGFEGMAFAMMETMVNNLVGQHLYPSSCFVEAGRQIPYATML